eukprot:scaffold49739_cov59-Phaeocystis_antarctica.AAC.5
MRLGGAALRGAALEGPSARGGARLVRTPRNTLEQRFVGLLRVVVERRPVVGIDQRELKLESALLQGAAVDGLALAVY